MREFIVTEVVLSILIDKLLYLKGEQRIARSNLNERIDTAISELHRIRELLERCTIKDRDIIKDGIVELLQTVYQAEDSIDIFLIRTTSTKKQHRRRSRLIAMLSSASAKRDSPFFNEMQKFMNQVSRFSSSDGFLRLQPMIGLGRDDFHSKLIGADPGETSTGNGQRCFQSWRRIPDCLEKPSSSVTVNEDMVDCLDNSPPDVLVVSGSQGSGKTTWVRAVSSKSTLNEAQIWYWININSREFSYRDLLIQLWKLLKESINEVITRGNVLREWPRQFQVNTAMDLESLSEEKAAEEVKSRWDYSRSVRFYFPGPRSKRDFIVLDDVCQSQHMQLVSRLLKLLSSYTTTMIVTTCDPELAKHLVDGGIRCKSFQLERLTNEASWQLLLQRNRSVGDESDEKLKRNVCEMTQGSPLAIILLRGMLSFVDRRSEWSRMIDLVLPSKDQATSSFHGDSLTVSSKIFTDGLATLANYVLPSSLKPLLIYFGLFPKGYEIRVQRLVRLWLAEGLITSSVPAKKMEAEDLAMIYLKELVNSDLIDIQRWSLDGSPRTCRMPGMLYDALFPEDLDVGFFRVLDRSKFEVRRVAECTNMEKYPCSDANIQHLRTFVSLDTKKRDSPATQIGQFLNRVVARKGFRLLTILDLEGVFKPLLPEALGDQLVNLVYLGLRWTALDSLPTSVASLLRLEVLDLKHTDIKALPASIWKTESLQHLFLNSNNLDIPIQKPSDRFLTNLKTLSGLLLWKKSPLMHSIDMFQFNGLTKLSMTFFHSISGESSVPTWISRLTTLKSLKLRSIDEFGRPSVLELKPLVHHQELCELYLLGIFLPRKIDDLGLPRNLKVLTLSLSRLEDDPMPALGKLPHLNILGLLGSSYLGNQMTCEYGSFPEVRVLKLWKLENLQQWTVKQEALPQLVELEIRRCKNLSKLSGLANVSTLKELILTGMPFGFQGLVKMEKGEPIITVKDAELPNRIYFG